MDAEYEFHPIANACPLMNDAELESLIADIKANGLNKEIELYQGMVLDGRNRYRACKTANVPIRTRNFAARDDAHAVDYVVSANLRRKQYSVDQLSMSAQKLADMKVGGGGNQYTTKCIGENSPMQNQAEEAPVAAPISLKKAAEKDGVGYEAAKRARKVANKAPAAVEPVLQGKIKIKDAEKLIKEKGGKPTESDVQKLIEEKEKPKVKEAAPKLREKPAKAHQKPEARAAAAAVVDGKTTEAEAVRCGIPRPVLRNAIIAEEARSEIKVDHETYQLILWCLHPDRIKDDRDLKAKYERAFLAFSKLRGM